MNEQIDLKKDVTPLEERDTIKHDRLTVIFQAAHDHCCVAPVAVEGRFSVLLETTEQAWVRELKINQVAKFLDFGFLVDAGIGYFCVTNNAKPRGLEDKTGDGDLVICYGDDLAGEPGLGWVVPPGGFFFGMAQSPERLQVYSKGVPITVTLTAFPK